MAREGNAGEFGMLGWLFGPGDNFKTLSPGEVRDMIHDKSSPYVLVDVREDKEWVLGRIPGAIHVPLSRFAQAADRIPKDKQIIFYCATGMRSRTALRLAKQAGLTAEAHLEGGLSHWRRFDLPIIR
jgi:rhodanese-related sulfurtransferase